MKKIRLIGLTAVVTAGTVIAVTMLLAATRAQPAAVHAVVHQAAPAILKTAGGAMELIGRFLSWLAQVAAQLTP